MGRTQVTKQASSLNGSSQQAVRTLDRVLARGQRESRLSSSYRAAGDVYDPNNVRLDVPLVMQLPELPTGCEATSVAMMLKYLGIPVTKLEIADKMPYDDFDPTRGFVGSPYDWAGVTIYPEAFEDLVRSYAGSYINLSGATLEDLKLYLRASRPVVCWISNGEDLLHCVCVTGYDSEGFFVNDPLVGAAYMDNETFEELWEYLGNLALCY
ncbi:MAG: C39 family peptidase [Coriobacteriales bacterium]|jgi:uncharacterized protein YvpB|nr:C39 family peptidase [Coriobacteriales bacterium]